MAEQDQKIRELEDRLERLIRTQVDFQKEVSLIRGELLRMRDHSRPADQAGRNTAYTPPPKPAAPPPRTPEAPKRPIQDSDAQTSGYELPRHPPPSSDPVLSSATTGSDPFSRFVNQYTENARANLEEFIGKNLISLIGIIVLILGVGIGAKYAIDNNWISPLMRIVAGYVFGFGLVGIAIKLKAKYHNFSAVLISGGMAILYFVTYFAYSSYGLIPQLPTFGLMVMFTICTVTAALVYGRQVIAHIGLVGAYAVPFLLSNDSGNYLALFIYMSVVNTGILAVSVKKDWKAIFYTSSAFTWLIFAGWFLTKFSWENHFLLAIVFLGVFFGIFFATKVGQAALSNTDSAQADVHENLVAAFATCAVFYLFAAGLNDTPLDPGRLWIFFSYIAAISVLILAISFRFYGRAFMYLVVPAVWLIFGSWFALRYSSGVHFNVAAVFAALFFGIFYFSILYQRLVEKSFTFIEHTSLILANAFVAYGFGYAILDRSENLGVYLGVYTAAHSGLHLIVAFAVGKLKSDAVDVVQVLTILVLTFASVAIPVQFDGNVITMIWATEAAMLFWFGRTRSIRLFERFSYPLMALATVSMFWDWANSSAGELWKRTPLTPFANSDFITAIIFVVAFGFIFMTDRDRDHEAAIPDYFRRPFGYLIPALGGFVLYNMFRIEIGNYFHLLSVTANGLEVDSRWGPVGDLFSFNIVWQINYTVFFLIAMAAVNLWKVRSSALAVVNCLLAGVVLLGFATFSMVFFYELRTSFVAGIFQPDAVEHWMYIAIRPLSYLFVTALLYYLYRYSTDELLTKYADGKGLGLLFEAIAYTFAFIVVSCELVNLMEQFHIGDSTKLGLSILWGVYALMMVVIGIARDKKHLRIAAFALLGVTLVKLFLYDIADLDTIPKTILFVTLGITLLVVSFLYNKYKRIIFNTDAAP